MNIPDFKELKVPPMLWHLPELKKVHWFALGLIFLVFGIFLVFAVA